MEVYESNTRYNALYTTEDNKEVIESWGFSYDWLMGTMLWIIVEVGSTAIVSTMNDVDFQSRFSINETPSEDA